MKIKNNFDNNTAVDLANRKMIVWCSLLIVALHGYAAFTPVATTWGFHFLGFYPVEIILAALLLFCFFITTKGQLFLLGLFQRLSQFTITRFFPFVIVLAQTACIVLLFWLLREQTFFLGDGNLIQRTIQNIAKLEEVVIAFRNEPFAGWIIWRVYRLLASFGVAHPEELAFQSVSILSGLGTFFIIGRFTSLLTTAKLDRILVGTFIVGSGFVQLFFGYVELYAPSTFVLLLYFFISLQYVRGKVPVVSVAVVFGILTALQLGMQSLAPSFAFLLILEIRRRGIVSALVSGIVSVAVFSILLLVSGYTWITFWNHLTVTEKPHFLTVAMSGNIWQAYSLFSLWHFIDMINLAILLSPFLIFIPFLFHKEIIQKENWKNPEWLFLVIASVSTLLFVFVVNSDLGTSRDWDLLGTFIIPSIVGSAYLVSKQLAEKSSIRPLLAMVVGITLLHSAFWVMLNASSDRSFARFTSLQDQRLWSKGALCNAYEELSIYFRDHGNIPKSVDLINEYLTVDSTNSRIWVSKASLLLQAKDYARALDAGRRAVQLDSTSSRAQNNLGAIIVNSRNDWAGGLPYFLRAFALDSTLAEASLNAGLCYKQLGNKEKMKLFWERFLQQAPHSSQAATIRAELEHVQ